VVRVRGVGGLASEHVEEVGLPPLEAVVAVDPDVALLGRFLFVVLCVCVGGGLGVWFGGLGCIFGGVCGVVAAGVRLFSWGWGWGAAASVSSGFVRSVD
jgi:hypothetical protein